MAATTQKIPEKDAALPLQAARVPDPLRALGMSVNYLMSQPSFSRLSFTHWSNILAGQIKRKHYFFVVRDNEIVGLAGWALTQREPAEAWLAGKGELAFDKCLDGPCLIINIWQSDGRAARKFMLEQMRLVAHDREMVYARRTYADGRMRPVRLAVNKFTKNHIRRSG